MQRIWILMTVLLTLVLFPAVSQAKDYCISFTAVPGIMLVGSGFSVPKKGTCKSWLGFDAGSLVTVNVPSSGVGCTSSDGSHLSLTLTLSNPEEGGIFGVDSITMTLPAQTGTDFETSVSAGDVAGPASNPVAGAECKNVGIPPSIENQADAPRTGLPALVR